MPDKSVFLVSIQYVLNLKKKYDSDKYLKDTVVMSQILYLYVKGLSSLKYIVTDSGISPFS